jgi:predicted nucleic acid-binding Zn ribbon protein
MYCAGRSRSVPPQRRQRTPTVNRIIWLVGAVVIILFVLGYFGLR